MKFRWPRVIVSVVITSIIGLMIWVRTDIEAVARLVSEASLLWFAVGVSFFFGYQVFRAMRIRVLAGGTTRTGPLTVTMMVQAFANNMLPWGIGEVVQVWLLKHRHGVEFSRGAGVLIVARLSDLLIFILLFVILQFFSQEIPEEVCAVMLMLTGCLAVAIASLLAVTRIDKRHLTTGWRSKIGAFIAAIDESRNWSLFGPLLGISTIMWVLMFGVFVAVLRTLNSDVGLVEILWIYILFFPVNILPVKGVASIGTHHLAWYLTLQLVGVEEPVAAALAFGAHLVLLGIVCAVAVPGMMLMVHGLEGTGPRRPK